MTQLSIASQRHYCLSAARRVATATKTLAARWQEHQLLLEHMTTLKVKAEARDTRNGYATDAKLVLPTEAPWRAADADLRRAWSHFLDTLQQSPAVHLELFRSLGVED